MKTIEVLIATMGRKNIDFIKDMNIMTDAVIVNQYLKENIEIFHRANNIITLIESPERGLSKSRNIAIKHSTADICVIADDDEEFLSNYEEIILDAYEKYPEADIIAFQVKRVGNPDREKIFRNKMSWENYITSMKVSSVEITFRRRSIIENKITFNENIGAGTKFSNGEENIFLYEALKKGLKILYLPINIGYVDNSSSSWFESYNDDYFYSVGAKFYNMSSKFYSVLIIQFAIRKYNLYKTDSSLINAIKKMFYGVKLYKEEY